MCIYLLYTYYCPIGLPVIAEFVIFELQRAAHVVNKDASTRVAQWVI